MKAVLISRFNQHLFEVELGPWHTMDVIDINGKTVKFVATKYEDYLKLVDGKQALSKKQLEAGWVIFLEEV